MRSRTAEGRVLAVLDYEGEAGEDDPAIAHRECAPGVALCGADCGEFGGGLDCPACESLATDALLEAGIECVAFQCVEPEGCAAFGSCELLDPLGAI